MKRRQFLTKSVKSFFIVAAFGSGWGIYLESARANPPVLRPPGAISEEQFAATCIKCGHCVEACPYDSIALADIAEQKLLGTPYIDAKKQPCYMCPEAFCTAACPSGALDMAQLRTEEGIDIFKAKMGRVEVDYAKCLTHCSTCFEMCPVDGAVVLREDKAQMRPAVDHDICTGCGVCVHACGEIEAITLYPASNRPEKTKSLFQEVMFG